MGQRRFEATRCGGCGLHDELCVCAHRPSLSLATALLIVQNNKERHKPTNTARMLAQVLTNCELIQFGVRELEFDASPLTRPERDYLLIFPRVFDPEGRGAEPALILDPEYFAARKAARPGAILTVVLLDGTWAQCSRMSRRIPELAAMQAFALPEGPPSHWGVRVPSEPSRISSFEAGVRVIELAEGPAPASAMQAYFDHVAAGMQFMKAKLRSPAVPEQWIQERAHRFGDG
jgi:DTW domain-containing protein YfiP